MLRENVEVMGNTMKSFLKTLAAAVAISILLWPLACRAPRQASESSQSTQPTPVKRLRVALILPEPDRALWQSVRQGAQDAAAEFGVDIEAEDAAGKAGGARQAALVNSAVAARVDGIVLAPLDKKSLAGSLAQAARAEIPVVLLASDADAKNSITRVAPDDYQGGRLAALYVGKITRGHGAVLVVQAPPNSRAARDREQGFAATLRKKFPKLKIVRSTASGAPWSVDEVERALAAHPEITMVFSSARNASVDTSHALRSSHLSGKIKLVGFGTGSLLVAALQSGDIKALVVRNPVRMGYAGVQAVVDFAAGRAVAPRIDSGVKLITQPEMDTPENRKLLAME